MVLDTETTGLPRNPNLSYKEIENWPRLVSIAWRIYDKGGNMLKKKLYYIEPGQGVVSSPEALAKHGITHEFACEHGVDLGFMLNRFIIDCYKCGHIVAHNAAYDKPVIYAELWRAGMSMPSCEWICTKEASVEICKIPASEKAKAMFPASKYKWPSLDELYMFLFDKPIPGREEYHGAAQDAAAVAECFWKLIEMGYINLEPTKKTAKVRFNVAYNIDFQEKDECIHIPKGTIFDGSVNDGFAYIKVLGDDVKVSVQYVDVVGDYMKELGHTEAYFKGKNGVEKHLEIIANASPDFTIIQKNEHESTKH